MAEYQDLTPQTEGWPRAAAPLLRWYRENARALPWRQNQDPYRVWVSEIMLQQTRVEAVLPYYERFLRELPTVQALAAAPEDRLLKLWEGLGYYSRARNLQKAARELAARGGFPHTARELRELPGIGDYTAGAVASIAFGEPEPAVDGNALRVRARLFADPAPIDAPETKRRAAAELRAVLETLPRADVGAFNQALMDLGASVCVPNGAPLCGSCPIAAQCEARRRGVERDLPQKRAKKPRRVEDRTVFALVWQGRLGLRKRPPRGLLAGMWELPSVDGALDERQAREALRAWGVDAPPQRLPDARHVFTHVEWRMRVYRAEGRAEGFFWATKEELARGYALPSAFPKIDF